MTADDQKNHIIQDEDHLEEFAYRWSTDRGLDPVKYKEIAKNLFPDIQGRPMLESGAGMLLNHFRGRIEEEVRNTIQGTSMLLPPASAWGLEVTKHLAIINTTGVAGSAALLTRFDQQEEFSLALILFTIGILISLITLWSGSILFSALLKKMARRLEILRAASNWDDYGAALGTVVSAKGFKAISITAAVSGVCAAVMAFSGMIIIIRTLWGMPA